jgi:hypothetical protein
MSSAEGHVLPKPGIPKTLGILNVIFGVIFVLLGVCGTGALILSPLFIKFANQVQKEIETKNEAQKKSIEKSYEERIATAKSDEEKQDLERQKANEIARQPKVNMNMGAAEDVLKDPKIMAVSYASMGAGLILHVILLTSGIGLIRLTPWGGSLACWWAGLQMVMSAVMLAVAITITLPASKPINDKQIATLEKAAQGKPANSIEALTLRITRFTTEAQVPLTVFYSLISIIYPIVILSLLNTQGARAALQAKGKMQADW